MQTRKAYRTCPLCEATCGLTFTLQGDRVVRVEGDDQDVLSRGYLCPKGASLGELHHDPDRLRHPMIRKGTSWEKVSWDRAFEEVERGLLSLIERHGRNSVAVFLGNPNAHTLAGALCVKPLLKGLGTRNVFSASSVDQMPRHMASGLLFGSPTAIPVPDIDRTDHLLILGANPLVSNGSLCTAPDFPGRLEALRARGGRVVVVDPRRTRTARVADEHLFIRPGTDPVFLLALLHTLFGENRPAPGRLTPFLTGLDGLKALALDFPPERVAPLCGIPPETIRRIARELSTARRAAVYGRMGLSTVGFGTLGNCLVDALNILTGNLDREGGAMFPAPAHVPLGKGAGGKGFLTGRWQSRVKGYPEVMGELPVATLVDEMETKGEGQVRALFTVAGNPVLSTPNSARLDGALARLPFMVSVDFYLNETTRHAHVILPPASPLCHRHYDFFLYGFAVRNTARYSPVVIPLNAEERDKGDILLKLALIAGRQGARAAPRFLERIILHQTIEKETRRPGSPFQGRGTQEIEDRLEGVEGPERLLDFLLRAGPYGGREDGDKGGLCLGRLLREPHGIDLGPLFPRLPEILQTPDGKIDLLPGPMVKEVRRLQVEMASPPAKGVLLVGRRHLRSNNSWMHNLPLLQKGNRPCTLELHPQDAAPLGLKTGDQVRVSSRVGALCVPVTVTEDIMPGVVSLPHGWGHDLPGIGLNVACSQPGVNSNLLADETCLDPLSGNAVLNGVPVTVEPCATAMGAPS